MENQSEKLDHQVAGLPSLCLASSRIQFSVHTAPVELSEASAVTTHQPVSSLGKARRIYHLAMEGERDPVRLHDRALGELNPGKHVARIKLSKIGEPTAAASGVVAEGPRGGPSDLCAPLQWSCTISLTTLSGTFLGLM